MRLNAGNVYVTQQSGSIQRGVDQASLKAQAAANLTIPFFQNTVKSPLDHHTYTFQIVGTDPTTSLVSTTVNYVPIVLRVHFADGTVQDDFPFQFAFACLHVVGAASKIYDLGGQWFIQAR